MRIPRPILWIVSVLAVLVGLPAFIYFVIYDHQNTPYCHKFLLLEVDSWLEHDKSGFLPNVDGRSTDSILELFKNTDGEWSYGREWTEKYRYVPGLRKGDPGDLVLMYMPEPTRYILHDHPQTIFAEKKWMLVSLDFAGQVGSIVGTVVSREMPLTGEDSERVSQDELRTRLRKTLDFLRANDRPNWQTVVTEHEKFLESIRHDDN